MNEEDGVSTQFSEQAGYFRQHGTDLPSNVVKLPSERLHDGTQIPLEQSVTSSLQSLETKTFLKIEHYHDKADEYLAKARYLKAKQVYRGTSVWGAALDWFSVFLASCAFIFLILWAASPDSAQLTTELALYRTLTYALPITLGFYGISRATRRGSHVPSRIANTLPYARFGSDGKLQTTTVADDKAGVPPVPAGQSAGQTGSPQNPPAS